MPMRPDLVDLEELKKKMFDAVLKSCREKKTEPWTLAELESVLSSLKSDKCLINELFLPGTAGKDLKLSTLMLFNRIKETNQIPAFMKIADISEIYKGKGSKNELKSERGIFIVSTYRSIFMKLLFKDKYQQIENNMSSSQIGARKKVNVRNHLWILNSIIQDVLKKKSIDLKQLDIRQCFDGLWPEECLSDIFRYGVQDHTINMLYDACKSTQVAMQTPVGITERKEIAKTVMQGDVWGPNLCAT